MSASQGPRLGRGRGRGSAAPTARGNKGDAARVAGRAAPTTATTLESGPKRQYRPSPAPNGSREAARRPSPSPSYGARGGSHSHSTPASTSPPRQEGRRKVGNRNAGSNDQRQMDDVYEKLKKDREQERKNAIKQGVLADPDKPTALANAITPVGTCQDMCPRFERAERIVQRLVDGCEKNTSSLGVREPREEKMVKRFRRSAAGYDEQLPSDIRPPLVLRMTLDYLIDEVVGGSQHLATVHKFVWDRTRGIRNDFSIQQVSKIEDLRIAIECFERIARFHILSLHQLSRSDKDNGEFDHHQEREQLNNTLLSLMYYYEDSRHKLKSPNEPEFRAYCVIFEIQDQRPDLEDRAQQWPRQLLRDKKVQTALKLYAAAGNTSDEQGPLRPRASFPMAQANVMRFWDLVQSNAVSYTMACVAEIYFNVIRRIALETIWKAYKGRRAGPTKMEDWVLADLTTFLGFDSEDQTQSYVEDHGFSIAESDNDQAYIDLGSLASRHLTDSNPRRKQIFSKTLVEAKRLGRTLPAIINGVTASQARGHGLIGDSVDLEEPSLPDHGSLFVSSESDDELNALRKSEIPVKEQNLDASIRNGDTTSLSTSGPLTPFGASKSPAASSATWSLDEANTSPSLKLMPTTAGLPSTGVTSSGIPPSFGRLTSPNPFTALSTNAGNATSFGIKSNTGALVAETATKFLHGSPKASSNPFHRSLLAPSPPSITNSRLSTSPFQASLDTAASERDQQEKPVLPLSASSSTPSSQELPSVSRLSVLVDPLEKQSAPNRIVETSVVEDINQPLWNESRTGKYTAPYQTQELPRSPPTNFTNPLPSLAHEPSSPESENLPSQFPTHPHQGLLVNGKVSSFLQENSPLKSSLPTEIPSEVSEEYSSSPTSPIPSFISKPITKGSTFDSDNSLNTNKAANLISQPRHSVNARSQAASLKLSSTLKEDLASSNAPRSSIQSTEFETSAANAPSFCAEDTPVNKAKDRHSVSNTLSEALMLDDEGLLQQFIEYTIGPLVAASARQIEEENSWRLARTCRVFLLSKKYLRLWKNYAWRMGLLRKGKERRKSFANSMRGLAKNLQTRQDTETILRSVSTRQDPGLHSATPPPADGILKQQSISADTCRVSQSPQVAFNRSERGHQSVHLDSDPPSNKANRKQSKTFSGHYRTDSTEHRAIDRPERPYSKSTNPSFTSKTDTTKTDYFRLKALGLNPDTPAVPLTSGKRLREDNAMGSEKRARISPHRDRLVRQETYSGPSAAGQIHDLETAPCSNLSSQTDDDPDEALYTRLRKVREAMSDSILWFQSERAKSEHTSIGSDETQLSETSAPKLLKTFRMTQSRTEQRLRTTGAQGLLPKAWASNPSWRDADGRITTSAGSESNTVSACGRSGAMDPPLVVRYQSPAGSMGLSGAKKAPDMSGLVAGSSVEDAIEL